MTDTRKPAPYAMREALQRYPISDPGKWNVDLNKRERECFIEGFNCAIAAHIPSPNAIHLANKVRYLHRHNVLGPVIGDYRISDGECALIVKALCAVSSNG